MIYEFTDKRGRVVEREYPVGEAPKIGEKTPDGLTRIVSRLACDRDARMRARREGIVDYTLPRKGRDPENPAPHYNDKEFAVFTTDGERREWLARSQDTSRPYFREDK